MLRRLPIYLLLDTSESMVGEPLDAVNNGLMMLASSLRQDPMAIEVAAISVITFDSRARQVVPLTEVIDFSPPTLHVGPGTSLGAALDLLGDCLKKEVRTTSRTSKGDWKPITFLLTDGVPTDDWQSAWKRFQKSSRSGLASLVAVGCGDDCDIELLKTLTSDVFLARDLTRENMAEFFRFVSNSVAMASVGIDLAKDVPLAPPGNLELGKDIKPTNRSDKSTPSQYLLAARCSSNGEGYLMRYRRSSPSGDKYKAISAHKVTGDYFSESHAGPDGQTIDSNHLDGAPACPYCGQAGWRLAKDKRSLQCSSRLELGSGRAQVMFVLDVTGSMADEIAGVKNNIQDFMSYVQKEGLSVEVGLIAFRDLEESEPPEILQFKGRSFTTNAKTFKKKVGALEAIGGGANMGESCYDAIFQACAQPFDQGVSRILIVITDEPPLLPDGEIRSIGDVTTALSRAEIDQLHFVIPDYLVSTYKPLQKQVKGEIFPLDSGGRGGASFRKVLLDIGKSISVTTRIG